MSDDSVHDELGQYRGAAMMNRYYFTYLDADHFPQRTADYSSPFVAGYELGRALKAIGIEGSYQTQLHRRADDGGDGEPCTPEQIGAAYGGLEMYQRHAHELAAHTYTGCINDDYPEEWTK